MRQPKEFEKRQLENIIIRDLKLFKTIKESFAFVHSVLFSQGHGLDLGADSAPCFSKANWSEGKSYNWLALQIGDLEGSTEIIIRQYGKHFTIYSKTSKAVKELDNYMAKEYSCFGFNSDTEKMDSTTRTNYDHMEDNFFDFQTAFPEILRLINEDQVHSMWNNYSLARPDHVDIQTAFYGDTIVSLDFLCFCAEELTELHLCLFAENEMLDMLKSLPSVIGKQFDRQYKIKEVKTDFPEQYSEPYYHGVGIALVDDKDRRSFQDVYSLTRYNFQNVLNLKNGLSQI